MVVQNTKQQMIQLAVVGAFICCEIDRLGIDCTKWPRLLHTECGIRLISRKLLRFLINFSFFFLNLGQQFVTVLLFRWPFRSSELFVLQPIRCRRWTKPILTCPHVFSSLVMAVNSHSFECFIGKFEDAMSGWTYSTTCSQSGYSFKAVFNRVS